MSKIRVYELAKELNKPAKEVISCLGKQGVKVTNHMSSIDEKQADGVRRHYASGKTGTEKPQEPGKGKDKAKKERPKKKASISAVYNPQNSKNGNRRQKSIVHNAENAKNRQERRKRVSDSVKAAAGKIADTAKRRTHGADSAAENREKSVTEEMPQQKETAVKEDRKQEHLQKTQNNPESHNTHGTRNSRHGKSGGHRPESENRQSRSHNGERNGSNEKNERSVQKNHKNDHHSNGGRSNNRHGGQNRQGRSKESRGGLDSKISRMNRNSAVSSSDDSRNRDRNKNKRHQDYRHKNNNAPKKKERYVNLEKKTGHKKKHATPQNKTEKRDEIMSIKLPEYMTIRELADRMKVQPSEIIKKLFLQGQVLTMNQEIDYEKAEEIALEFNCIAEPEEKVDVIAELLKEDEEDESRMVPRPPVVCVMGHVDHGKTSLLDRIRETHVTDREAGGITQHIGASVATINGHKITFLDTPGHEAFTAMRMRGANSTDIAILVVAADDGIMPQTIEAINHAKAAGIEIIVAINKIDKPGANIDMVKQGLAEQGLIPEDWGGSTICVPVSAKTGEGIDQLLEMVLLTAEILELKADPKRKARGLVIEAKLDKGRGAVATVLIQKGTLKVGEPVAAGNSYGKVRAMNDFKGKRIKSAGPSTPVEIIGLNNVPDAGEVLMAFDSEKDARSFAETFESQNREKLLDETRARLNLDNIFSQIQAGNLKELNLIVKADVQGSVEAVKQSLEKLSNDEVAVKVIHGAVGAITESDVNLAAASNAVIIGFNVKPDATAKSIAEHENVDVHLYSVIYKAIEDVERAIKGMLAPVYEERVIGHAEVRQLFKASGVGTIAGSYVLDGVVERDCKVRISREGKQIYEGALASLKRFKDDVKEVKAGYECGLVFDGFNDVQELDQVEAYKMVEVPRE